MGDLGPTFGAILEAFGPVIGAALKALLRTVAGMVLFGVTVTVAVVWISSNGSWVRGALAAVCCLVALAIVTGIVAVKNAVLRGLLAGVEKIALGQKLFRLVFDQLGVSEESVQGERAGGVGRALERLPLREAEAKLEGAVTAVLGQHSLERGVRAWLSRKLMAAALARVRSVTLARFRTQQAQLGGVDLLAVRNELGGAIDGLIARQVAAHLAKLNLLIAGLYLALAALAGLAASKLPLGG